MVRKHGAEPGGNDFICTTMHRHAQTCTDPQKCAATKVFENFLSLSSMLALVLMVSGLLVDIVSQMSSRRSGSGDVDQTCTRWTSCLKLSTRL